MKSVFNFDLFKNRDLFFLLFICLLFLCLTTANIYNTGFSSDEVAPGLWGIYILQGQKINFCSNVDIHLFGKAFPINCYQPYYFALPSYLLIPFFVIFGINVFALKLLSILLSLLTLILLYYVSKALFNAKTALITTFLLSLSPAFIYYTRIGLEVTETILNFFFIAAIFFYIQYYKKKVTRYLYIASYLFGTGLSIKLSFVSRLLGLLIIIFIFFRKESLNFIKRNLKIRQKLAAMLFFCLGAFLFIYFNIATKGETLKLARYLYTDVNTTAGPSCVNNLHFGNNLKVRLVHLKDLIEEKASDFPFSDDTRRAYLINKGVVFSLFVVALFINLFIVFLLKRNILELKIILSTYLFFAIMFFTSFFSPFTMRGFHLALLYPFPQLVMALFINYLPAAVNIINLKPILKKAAISIISSAFLLPFIILDARSIIAYHQNLNRTGGRGFRSPIVYEITDYVRKNKLTEYPIFCLEWFNDSIKFITKGEFDFDFSFRFSEYSNNRKSLYERLKFIGRFYFIADTFDSKFKQDIINLNRKLTLQKIFYNKSKEPQYYLYRVD